jgi:tRNA (guanine-N7-)-methyltransferase
MSRLKLKRFRVKPPPPETLARYLRVYEPRDLYHRPQTLPPITSATLFGNDRPLVLDLGCGRGEFVVAQAVQRPDENFAGLDWHLKSVWDAVNRAQLAGLDNVRFLKTDFRLAMPLVPNQSVREAYMLFPPPVLAHKRRSGDLLTHAMLRQIHRVLAADGLFHFVTDQPAYFELKQALMEQSGLFTILVASQAIEGGLTRYQQFWERFQIESRRLECRKCRV